MHWVMTETDAQNLLLGAHIVFLHNRAKLGPLFREIKSRMTFDFASFILCINVPEVATLFRTVLSPTLLFLVCKYVTLLFLV